MDSINIFTQKPFCDWSQQYSLFISKGALAFARKYSSPLSFLIQALYAEFGTTSDISETSTTIFETYSEGARLGDALCCLRLHEIYSSKDNVYDVIPNIEKAWLYIILAQFYSLCSPFGLEVEINPIFIDFITAMGDDLKLTKSKELLEKSDEISAKEYKEIIGKVLTSCYDQTLPGEENLEKFQNMLTIHDEFIDDLLIGTFLMNIFTGHYEADAKFMDNEKVHMYFNNRIVDIFRLYNVTFKVQGETHAMMLTAFAVNIWHFLLWKGKNYKGEIDECLNELLRTCRIIFDNKDRLNVSIDAHHIFTSILGACYAKGFFIKKNLKKALDCYNELNESELLQTSPNLMFDKARVLEKVGLIQESDNLKHLVYEKYLKIVKQIEDNKEDNVLANEYYILGVLEEIYKKNLDKAEEYFKKGRENVKGINHRPFESLAFQRKCQSKLQKIQIKNPITLK